MTPYPPSPRPAALIDIPDVRFSVVPQPIIILVKSSNVEINVAICF